jgi:hypothetical protein
MAAESEDRIDDGCPSETKGSNTEEPEETSSELSVFNLYDKISISIRTEELLDARLSSLSHFSFSCSMCSG